MLQVSGTGTPSSPKVYQFTNPTGSPSPYTVKYTNYPIHTNFYCSGVTEYVSPSQPLITSIVLPDNTQYSFTYEATPNVSGSVTGRISAVTCPTGGTINYTYPTGIDCGSGSPTGLTRSGSLVGTWSYSHSADGQTTMSDGADNMTVFQFNGLYEVQRRLYQNNSTAILLETIDTCYNGEAWPCNGAQFSPPFSEVASYTTLGKLVSNSRRG